MKKTLAILMLAGLGLLACTKEAPVTTDASGPLAFNLTVTHPQDTKAVKTAWEDGDVVFVFFSEAEAPRHLEMKYDAGNKTWIQTPKNGTTEESFSLIGGTMTAVYLPFGSGAKVVADGKAFKFDKTYYSYYFVASKQPYTVSSGVVSGNLDMTLPDNYVQFFIKDSAASDGAYTLGTDAVIPTGVASIAADGTITETSDKVAGDDMPGYAYGGGYLFSGKLDSSYSYGGYYFAKTKYDLSRADYFVTGKTLSSHSAIKLPANNSVYAVTSDGPNDGKWIPVGSDKTVKLMTDDSTDLGTWYTCNYNRRAPEYSGLSYTFDEANALGVDLPTEEQFERISIYSYCTWTWLSVHGYWGAVVKADKGFLFLPTLYETHANYWSSTQYTTNLWYTLRFDNNGMHDLFTDHKDRSYLVRPIKN